MPQRLRLPSRPYQGVDQPEAEVEPVVRGGLEFERGPVGLDGVRFAPEFPVELGQLLQEHGAGPGRRQARQVLRHPEGRLARREVQINHAQVGPGDEVALPGF